MVVAKLLAAVMALVLSVSAALLPVYAAPEVDFDYEGEIDPYTGAPADSEEEDTKRIVPVMTGVSYDRTTGLFRYTVPDSGDEVTCNLASGMVTTGKVRMSIPSNVNASLYKDGTLLTEVNYNKIEEPGTYSLLLSGNNLRSNFHTFTIVRPLTGALLVFQVPSGFSLMNVMLNDEKQTVSPGTNVVDMKQEGQYLINYRCVATGVNYSLDVMIDHTPPEVTFEGIHNGVARNPVAINGLANGDTVRVLRDGEKMTLNNDHVIRSFGSYVVTVTDKAGNAVTEEFKIEFYLNEEGWIFGLLIVAIIAAAAVYMILARKRLRVR